MTTKLFFFSFIICCSILSISCSNEDETVYSCNESTNEWTKSNLLKIREMTRSKWKLLSQSKKRAAYIAFTQSQKISFWKEKINNVLTLDWTKEEFKHINKVYEFICDNPIYFSEEELTDEQLNKFDLFFYEWIEDAQSVYKWDVKTIASIIASGDDMIDKTSTYSLDFETGGDVGAVSGPNCDCNMTYNFCSVGLQYYSCEDKDCIGTGTGCGILWTNSCNGMCE